MKWPMKDVKAYELEHTRRLLAELVEVLDKNDLHGHAWMVEQELERLQALCGPIDRGILDADNTAR